MGKKQRARRSRSNYRRRGVSVVEMAVVAPLMITMIFGVIEFGWTFMVRQMMANAVREGARVAAIQATVDDVGIRNAVRGAMESVGMLTIADADITVNHWCKFADGTPDFTEKITLTVEYDDVTLVGGYFGWFGQSSEIVTSSSMRKEGVTQDSPTSNICSGT